MPRVEGSFAGVTVLYTKPLSSFNGVAGNPDRVRHSLIALKRRTTVGKVVMAAMLLAVHFGGLQKGWAAEQEPPTPASIINVEPKVTHPDGIVTVTFNKEVTPSSVKIGATDATILSKEPARITVKVAPNTQLGTQDITVTLADGAASPLRSSITVAPEVAGLKAHKDAKIQLRRVAVAGGEIIIQFNGSIPSEMKQKLAVTIQEDWKPDPKKPEDKKPEDKEAAFTIPQNDYLILQVPEDLDPAKSYTVQVLADGTPLERKPKLRVKYVSSMYIWASLALGGLILLIYLLYKLFYKIPAGQTRYSFLKMLLLEQENQTYSLSRAQFVGWLTVISWCFLFLYYARGYVEESWAYPKLGNAVYAFFISLGTLVAAQATSIGQGVKGAGEVHPSPADLVVHGGVLALDRVQQVIWTLIALGMFLRITVSTYATATALPDIPPELLGLMGLSSVGYLGGKLVRGAGPVIEQVTVRAGSVILNIKGRHLSKECFVWLDGVKQPKDNVTPKADDPDSPLQFAKELEVKLEISMEDWYAKDHALTVINDDAQRADWRTGPEIIEATVAADKPTQLIVKGARLAKGATLEITGAADAKPVQDDKDPNLFTVEVPETWLKEAHELIVTSNGQKSSYTYKPSSS